MTKLFYYLKAALIGLLLGSVIGWASLAYAEDQKVTHEAVSNPVLLERLLREWQDQRNSWTLNGDTILTFPTNGLTLSNATDGSLIITEASEDIKLAFTANTITATSSTGVVTLNWGAIVPTANQMLFTPVADAVGTTEGTVFYDSDTDTLKYRNASAWISLTSGTGDNTLDDAYDQGGAGVGRTITADTGAVVITNTDADAAFLLSVTPTPGSSAATGGISITSGANATEDSLQITNSGSGYSISTDSDAFTVDATGAVAATSFTGAGAFTTLTSTGVTTLGDNSSTVAIVTSSWDVTTAGAASGITSLSLSDDITMANGKGVKSSTTTAQTVGLYGYDVDGAAYVGGLVITNSNTPATVLGNANGTTAITSSDWAIGTSGIATGLGNITSDGTITAAGSVVSAATPTIIIKDSDAAAGDNNVTLVGAATDTGDGTEDVDLTLNQQIAGTLRAVATFDADGNITLGYGTQDVVTTADLTVTGSDLTLGVAGVKLTGDGDGAITFLGLGDGSDEDLTLNLDDTANTGVFSSSTALDRLVFTGMTLDADQVEITAASPVLEFFDTDAAAGDINASITIAATDTGDGTEDIDVTFMHQSAGAAVNFLVADADGVLTLNGVTGITMSDTVTFSGGQTRKVKFLPKEIELDGTSPAGLADIGTDGQTNISVLTFDADGGATGDDIAYISWVVPDGYVVDSARLNVCYTFSTAEDAADEAQFDFTVNAVAAGEALDAAGTALADQTTVIANAAADNGKLHITQYNIEVEDIVVDDMVTIQIAVDESASALSASGTLNVLYFEIEYESTE